MAKREMWRSIQKAPSQLHITNVRSAKSEFSVRCISCNYGCAVRIDTLAVSFNCTYVCCRLTASPEHPQKRCPSTCYPSAGKTFSWPRSCHPLINVDHHVMHTPKNHQPSTKKLYYSMSFVSINLKFLCLVDNYASYYMQVFRARFVV